MDTKGASGSRPAFISERLYKDILDGTLKVGTLLPAQRELASRFGASMASVRSALGSLAAIGLIETIPGKGSIVRSARTGRPQFDGWLGIADSSEEMLDLLDARLVLERFHIEQAASSITPDNASRLEAAMERLAQCENDLDGFEEADYALHLTLAEASANQVTLKMLEAVRVSMRKTLHHTTLGYMDERGDLSQTISAHRRMVGAVLAGNSSLAIELLTEMIDRSRSTVISRKGN